MDNNALETRVPGLSPQYDAAQNAFHGVSPAEKQYHEASGNFVSALQTSGPGMSKSAAKEVLDQAQQNWQGGKHLPGLRKLTSDAQQAYRQAFTAYRPAQLDKQAKAAVVAGKFGVPASKDAHKNKVATSNAFLNDARNAVMNRR